MAGSSFPQQISSFSEEAGRTAERRDFARVGGKEDLVAAIGLLRVGGPRHLRGRQGWWGRCHLGGGCRMPPTAFRSGSLGAGAAKGGLRKDASWGKYDISTEKEVLVVWRHMASSPLEQGLEC